jgi:hypothetical protein
VVPDLGCDDLLLEPRQQPLRLVQSQTQIGDIAEIVGAVDFHDVQGPPRPSAPIFTNVTIHATRSPQVKDRPENARVAWRPQNLRQSRAKREKALIYWADETGISNQDQMGRSYAAKGQTPVVRLTAKKISTSMISAVNNQGLIRFMCYKGALNASLFIVFLRRLIKAAAKKVFLIVDNLRVYHAVKEGVQLGQRVALYCRVSTADQSCARQERDLTAFAIRLVTRWSARSRKPARG